MKRKLLLAIALLSTVFAHAQLVSCRPKIAMVYYGYHNDAISQTDMLNILANKPDILIQATPTIFWAQWPPASDISIIPAQYLNDSIQVFSYITGGREGTKYGVDTDGIVQNLARVDSLANHGVSGVFLDEVDNYPTGDSMDYITSIYNECHAKGLKLIINTGVHTFDTALMSRCDYIMTDEQYSGSRHPTTQEAQFHDRVIVVSYGITTDTDAANVSYGARDNGFGYSYACELYTVIPSYLSSYLSLITKKPSTPSISQSGNTLFSSALFGNQWYKDQDMMAGYTDSTIVPTSSGTYYSLVTLQGCSSDTSNKINFTVQPTGIANVKNMPFVEVVPNPANNFIIVSVDKSIYYNIEADIYDVLGRQVKSVSLEGAKTQIYIGDLNNGIYSVIVRSNEAVKNNKLIVRH
jgi:hypothetical protein